MCLADGHRTDKRSHSSHPKRIQQSHHGKHVEHQPVTFVNEALLFTHLLNICVCRSSGALALISMGRIQRELQQMHKDTAGLLGRSQFIARLRSTRHVQTSCSAASHQPHPCCPCCCREASVRAVKDALLHSSLPAVLSLVPGGHEKVKIRVKVGTLSSAEQ